MFAVATAAAFAQQPRIDGVSPAQGPIAGGTIVTVRGEHFTDAVVRLDQTAVTPLSRSDSELRLQMPQHDNGYVVISARTASGAAYGEFLYVPPRLEELPAGFITTVAGMGSFTRGYGVATQATFLIPWGLSLDRSGNLYVGDASPGIVYRISGGTIERVAGGGGMQGEAAEGGAAIDAMIGYSRQAAFDDAGNMYVASNECRVRKVSPSGTITTYAGTGQCGYAGDGGPASLARIGSPSFIAADRDDLFFIDFAYATAPVPEAARDSVHVRRVHFADGTISTFAGNGSIGFSGDSGPATQASFDFGPRTVDAGGIALDPHGNVYIADTGNNRIRRIDRATGIITTIYQPSAAAPDSFHGDILAIAFDTAGNLYFSGGGRIEKVSPSGQFLQAWGNGRYGLPVDGVPAATAPLGHDVGLAVDAAGNIDYADDAIMRVRRINIATGLVETIAGIGPQIIGENGPAIATTAAMSTEGTDLAFAPAGELVLGDAGAFRIRRLERDGTLKTIGGTGSFVGSFDDNVPATTVSMYPIGIYIDAKGAIDTTERSEFKHIEPDGRMVRMDAHPDCGYSGDGGNFRDALFCQAWDIVRDRAGNLLIADSNNNRIRRVDAQTNIVTTIAGNGAPPNGFERYGLGRSCGDGGPAIDACINTPYGLAFDDDGNLYVSELFAIRKITPSGTISTLASSKPGFPTKLRYWRGSIYAAYNGIWRFDARTGARTAINEGGNGSASLGDGGPAISARTSTGGQGDGIAIDAEGNLFFADVGNRRVRVIRYGALLAPRDASIEASANGTNIRAIVRDGTGTPAQNVRVGLTAPASGPSCRFGDGSRTSGVVTDGSGVATAVCTPICSGAGTFVVTVQPAGSVKAANVTMSDVAGPCRQRVVGH